MTVLDFDPAPALIGGIFIGLAAAILLLFSGKIFGISGMLSGVLSFKKGEWEWRLLIIVGLIIGALIGHELFQTTKQVETRPYPYLIIGGFIVGIAARIGSGCTSGHGICGIARFSTRSIVATITFILSGIVTVAILRMLGV